MKLTYHRNGDYLLPDLAVNETDQQPLGKYGMLRLHFLETHRPVLYNDLLLSGGSSGQFDALYEKYKIFDTCNTEQSENYARVCKQQVINKAIQFEQTDEIQGQVSQMLGEINSLSNRIALSRDTKESQDLANSIQLKSVMLNTLTDQWEISVKAAEQREKVLENERIKQWNQQQLNAPTLKFHE